MVDGRKTNKLEGAALVGTARTGTGKLVQGNATHKIGRSVRQHHKRTMIEIIGCRARDTDHVT